MDSARKGKQIDFGGKEGCICAGQSINHFSLGNYCKRWNNTETALWTDSRVGNYQYMGWKDSAYLQFDGLCKQIREYHQSRSNMKVEQVHLARSHSWLARGPHSRCLLVGQVETNIEVYKEPDSEDKE
jgi:hypothetical protein